MKKFFIIAATLFAHTTYGVHEVSYLYAHGIADTHKQAYWYVKYPPKGPENSRYLIDGRLFTFDFPDATQAFWRINCANTSLGQANELSALYQAYNNAVATLTKDTVSTDIVLIGLSRGAAAGLTFLGLFKTPHIKAAIFESPFDSHENLVKAILEKIYLDTIPGMQTIGSWLMQCAFMQYKKDGICPLDALDCFPKHVPVLIVCSKEDSTVPYQSTIEVYKKLKNAGNEHAYILILSKGKHAHILQGEDGEIYQNVVHAFYKKYHLPNNPEFAEKGYEMLEKSRPHL